PPEAETGAELATSPIPAPFDVASSAADGVPAASASSTAAVNCQRPRAFPFIRSPWKPGLPRRKGRAAPRTGPSRYLVIVSAGMRFTAPGAGMALGPSQPAADSTGP